MDTSATVAIAVSRGKVALLTLGALVLTIVSAAETFHFVPGLTADGLLQVLSLSGTLFFGFCTLVIPWRMVRRNGAVITLSPEGICDSRLHAKPIPWSSVTSIDTWQFAGQQVMVLALDAQTEHDLVTTPAAKIGLGLSRRLGADGINISASGLATTYADLLKVTQAYHAAFRRTGPPPPSAATQPDA